MTTVDTPVLPPEAAAQQLVFQLATGYMASAALQTVLQLEIPNRLSAGPRPVAELAKEAGANEDALYRVMRALASLGVFDEQAPRTFANTMAGSMLRHVPGSFHDMGIFLSSPVHFRIYAEMLHSVQTGQPAVEKVMGMPAFEYLARDENRDFATKFNNAMTMMSGLVAPAVLEVYDFTGIGTLVDVAGGHGFLLTSILKAYPGMRGILFDLPHVVSGASGLIAAAGVTDRCETASGDFFQAVPQDGDAYIMKHIIHDWDDERATAILKNIRAALAGRPNGRLILVDSVIEPGNQPDLAKLIDLEMLMLPGGKERTEAEFRALFAGAGFTLTRVVRTRSPLAVVEGRPV
ncbi:MAG TPA: methyltransferase [Vicinamibacterales bacterium]|nr:methyltransferase [Vicinamibacterales bacterium]